MLPTAERSATSSPVSCHQPVMVEQVIGLLLRSDPSGTSLKDTIVDGTVGGGGHAKAILDHLAPNGHLVCLDRDPRALDLARTRLGDDPRIEFRQANYADLDKIVPQHSVSGILLDLGLSSDQLSSQRGFSFDHDSALDMRFDPGGEITAYDVINRYAIAKLRDIFFKFGEEPLSPRIARRIGEVRKSGAIRSTAELAKIIMEAVPARFSTKALARVFQAIRIEVNGEVGHLERGLEACWETLRTGGVLCIIAYHSIEDRRVKRFIAQKVKGCTCPPRLPVCACGKKPTARPLLSTPLRPTPKEIRINPRSRSARLRAAVRIESK